MSLPSCRSVFDCFVLEVFRPKVQFRTTLQLSSIVMVLVGGHLGGTAISHCSQMAAIATREVRTGIFRTLKPLLDPRLPLQGPDPCTPPPPCTHAPLPCPAAASSSAFCATAGTCKTLSTALSHHTTRPAQHQQQQRHARPAGHPAWQACRGRAGAQRAAGAQAGRPQGKRVSQGRVRTT